MTERRPLSQGVTLDFDPQVAKEFVQGGKPPTPAEPVSAGQAPPPMQRVPLSTRVRADYFEALKRASLERQLSRVEPNTLIEILEQALEPWLRSNGYLS